MLFAFKQFEFAYPSAVGFNLFQEGNVTIFYCKLILSFATYPVGGVS